MPPYFVIASPEIPHLRFGTGSASPEGEIPNADFLEHPRQSRDNIKAPNTNAQNSLELGVLIFGFIWILDFEIWNLANEIATLRSQ